MPFFIAYPVAESKRSIAATESSSPHSRDNAITLPMIPGVEGIVVVVVSAVVKVVVAGTEVVGIVVIKAVVATVVSGHGPQGPPQSTPVSL